VIFIQVWNSIHRKGESRNTPSSSSVHTLALTAGSFSQSLYSGARSSYHDSSIHLSQTQPQPSSDRPANSAGRPRALPRSATRQRDLGFSVQPFFNTLTRPRSSLTRVNISPRSVSNSSTGFPSQPTTQTLSRVFFYTFFSSERVYCLLPCGPLLTVQYATFRSVLGGATLSDPQER
jgi:hypothetical protein